MRTQDLIQTIKCLVNSDATYSEAVDVAQRINAGILPIKYASDYEALMNWSQEYARHALFLVFYVGGSQ